MQCEAAIDAYLVLASEPFRQCGAGWHRNPESIVRVPLWSGFVFLLGDETVAFTDRTILDLHRFGVDISMYQAFGDGPSTCPGKLG